MIRKSPNQNPQNLTLNIVLTLIVTLLALLARKGAGLGPEHPSASLSQTQMTEAVAVHGRIQLVMLGGRGYFCQANYLNTYRTDLHQICRYM